MTSGWAVAPRPDEGSSARARPGKADRQRTGMRIIYHHRTRLRDAQGIHVRAIVRALRELGHEVEVISLPDSPSEVAAAGSSPGIETNRLPSWLYEVLSLAYLRDLSHSELAEQLKLPLGTVKTWIRRGLEQLRGCMARFA